MDKNKELLSLLAQDCRRTPRQLAAILGESEDEVRQRIAKLESSGAIVKYSAILNDEMLDRDSVHAMIEVKVTPQKSKGFDAIAEEICRYPEVKSVYLISGDFDLAVFIEGKSLRSVSLFVSEKLSAIESVLSTATHFILKKYKVEGVVTTKTGGGRLPVQP